MPMRTASKVELAICLIAGVATLPGCQSLVDSDPKTPEQIERQMERKAREQERREIRRVCSQLETREDPRCPGSNN